MGFLSPAGDDISRAERDARDSAAMQRLKEGDESALEELYDRHSALMLGVARKIVRADVGIQGDAGRVLSVLVEGWKSLRPAPARDRLGDLRAPYRRRDRLGVRAGFTSVRSRSRRLAARPRPASERPAGVGIRVASPGRGLGRHR